MIMDHRDLSETVKHMAKLCKRGELEVLRQIRFVPDMEKKTLSLVATDCETWLERTLPIGGVMPDKPVEPFFLNAYTVAKVLNGKAKEVSWKDDTEESERRCIKIMSDGVLVTLHPTLGLDDQPEAPKGEQIFSCEGKSHLVNHLKYVSQAMSTDATRYNLNGILFDESRIVATDGHRMHFATYGFAGTEQVIMPAGMVNTILALKPKALVISFRKDPDDTISIHCLTDQGYIVRSKALDGQFPDYEQVIPKDVTFTMRTQVKVEDFEKALKKGMKFASSRNCEMKMKVNTGLHVTVDNIDMDLRAETGVQGRNLHRGTKWNNDEQKHEPLEHVLVGFNANYMLDAMKHTDSEIVLVSVIDDLSPIVLTFPDHSYKSIVMPLRI